VSRIEFERREGRAEFLDQKEGYAKREISFQIRKDPLTGHLSRILPFRRKVFETALAREILEASQKGCPFCPGQVESFTPKFIPEIAAEGRIRKGRAVSFPNVFPYAHYNWVVVLSDEHFYHLDQFTAEVLRDGFLVGQEGIQRVGRMAPDFVFSSINWNYLPQSGGGLYHPHLQVVVDQVPTVFQRKGIEGIRRYQKERGSFYWEDLLSEEMDSGERYVGRCGDVHFLAAYSPQGILGEIITLFAHRFTIDDITEEDWTHFSEGLTRIFRYLKERQTFSFNLALICGTDPEVQSWVYAKLCPRILIPPWNTSDINYFEKLHGEVICVISPEEMAEDLKLFFRIEKR
jgi:UDPglucose--hexose-1-phosphate uridylyltransferase